jgi:hypothetical protein
VIAVRIDVFPLATGALSNGHFQRDQKRIINEGMSRVFIRFVQKTTHSSCSRKIAGIAQSTVAAPDNHTNESFSRVFTKPPMRRSRQDQSQAVGRDAEYDGEAKGLRAMAPGAPEHLVAVDIGIMETSPRTSYQGVRKVPAR